MTNETANYSRRLRSLLDRLCAALEGLDETQLNWRPPASNANSTYVIGAHVVGNAEAWVLGIACSQAIKRDRPGEFAAAGPDAAPLVARARDLADRIEEALSALPPEALEEVRQPSQSLYGEGTPRSVTVREALVETIDHAATHLGQIEVTRDLAMASGRS
jgi:uncharacterized damage-inducible protein DinB